MTHKEEEIKTWIKEHGKIQIIRLAIKVLKSRNELDNIQELETLLKYEQSLLN
jgi:hypothetical protein